MESVRATAASSWLLLFGLRNRRLQVRVLQAAFSLLAVFHAFSTDCGDFDHSAAGLSSGQNGTEKDRFGQPRAALCAALFCAAPSAREPCFLGRWSIGWSRTPPASHGPARCALQDSSMKPQQRAALLSDHLCRPLRGSSSRFRRVVLCTTSNRPYCSPTGASSSRTAFQDPEDRHRNHLGRRQFSVTDEEVSARNPASVGRRPGRRHSGRSLAGARLRCRDHPTDPTRSD
jgi:hypothetical protein